MTAAIRAEFERCRGWLEAALAHGGESSADELLGELLANRAQLWPGEACVVVTTLVLGERGGEAHAWLGGGDLGEMVGLRPGIEAWARSQGAVWTTINGRRGWARLYRPFGYRLDEGGMLRKRL